MNLLFAISKRGLCLLLIVVCLSGCASSLRRETASGWLACERADGELERWNWAEKKGEVQINATSGTKNGYDFYKGRKTKAGFQLFEVKIEADGVSVRTNAAFDCAWQTSNRLKVKRTNPDGTTKEMLFILVAKDTELSSKLERELTFNCRFPWMHLTHRYEGVTASPTNKLFGAALGERFQIFQGRHVRDCQEQNIERTWFDWHGNDPFIDWSVDYELMEWREDSFMGLLVRDFQHTHGAGGTSAFSALNLWCRDGVVGEVKLEELFASGTQYRNVIQEYVAGDLKRRQVDTTSLEMDTLVYVFTRHGILCVVPSQADEERVLVPWNMVKTYLADTELLRVLIK